jgi:glutamate synthase domain-containing protein 3
MKGGTLIVEGSVGYLAGFMTHAGDLIVLGDAGEGLGDSLWEGRIYVAGRIRGLGNDAMVVEPDHADRARVQALLAVQGIHGSFDFRKVVAGRRLWYFDSRHPEAWLAI